MPEPCRSFEKCSCDSELSFFLNNTAKMSLLMWQKIKQKNKIKNKTVTQKALKTKTKIKTKRVVNLLLMWLRKQNKKQDKTNQWLRKHSKTKIKTKRWLIFRICYPQNKKQSKTTTKKVANLCMCDKNNTNVTNLCLCDSQKKRRIIHFGRSFVQQKFRAFTWHRVDPGLTSILKLQQLPFKHHVLIWTFMLSVV